jgi:hypothetical protein
MKREAIQVHYSADKNALDLLLKKVLQSPMFCGNMPVDFHRITKLLGALKDELSFIVEFPYTDSHYRDCYYFYHAAKFEDLPRETLRVHIFASSITSIESLCAMATENERLVSDSYFGFFIVRPLNRFPLGHSFISPRAFKRQDFLCCLIKERVYLLGVKLTVCAFPHVAQDTETHTCAESSLWALLTYYGSKYRTYQTLLPSDIIRHLNSVSAHRMLPSNGLTVNELSTVLTQDGHNCVLYTKNTDEDLLLQIMRIYIESGIPLIVALENEQNGHAVVAIGHGETKCPAPAHGWQDMCEYDRNIVFIDDNMAPYQLARATAPAEHYGRNLADMEIASLVVPLQKHMFLEARQAYTLVKHVLNHKAVGLMNFGSSWQTRLLLTSGRAFKNSLLTDKTIAGSTRNALLRISLPKFIWLCEIYEGNNLSKEKCNGIIVLDSTGGNSLSSVILYILNDKNFITDGMDWIQYRPIPTFEKRTYKHNLKGAWNKWMN